MSNGEQPDECTSCKLFIGGLHLDTDNERLREYFEKYGEVLDSVVMRDGETRKSRGFGFITFSDISQALVCLDSKPHMVDDKEVSPQ
jgi:RNA recognition motif-containing protein